MACWLLANGKLYRNEERCLFQQGIPTLLWAKLVYCLEITMPDHHPEDPYKVDNVFEAAKWILKGTDMSTGLVKPVAPTPSLITNPTITTAARTTAARTPAAVKTETLDATTNAIISMLACMGECMAALLNGQSCTPCTLGNGSYFYGEVGHSMVRGNCLVLEAFIQQGKV